MNAAPKKSPSATRCPLCSKAMPPKTVICCPDCWWKLPAGDRAVLGALHRHKNQSGIHAKLQSIKSRPKGVV